MHRAHGIRTGDFEPIDHKTWMTHAYWMLEQCESFAILELPGHDASKGVAEEILWAEANFLTVQRFDPKELCPNTWAEYKDILENYK